MSKLTVNQERFCQEYVMYGNKSRAYRIAYDAENMTKGTLYVEAHNTFKIPKVSLRIKELNIELQERFKSSLDKVVSDIVKVAQFDIAEIYQENGQLKPIQDIPKHIRAAILSVKTLEEFDWDEDGNKTSIGFTKEIKTINKLDALKELMKHFGGYEKDNNQKDSGAVVIFNIPDNGRG